MPRLWHLIAQSHPVFGRHTGSSMSSDNPRIASTSRSTKASELKLTAPVCLQPHTIFTVGQQCRRCLHT